MPTTPDAPLQDESILNGGCAVVAADPEAPMTAPVADGGDSIQQLGPDHYRCEVVIVNEMGLHARPATQFVKLANEYACDVSIHKGNQQVDGKSILQLFSLAAECGTPLILEGRGADAQSALAALASLVRSGFHEMGA